MPLVLAYALSRLSHEAALLVSYVCSTVTIIFLTVTILSFPTDWSG